ncbi:metal-sulfur cluster biosynthetic enzyme [Leptospira hartskeerlii]|uniref:Metal-sulfur cluster assembly factor n=3 Tax=Leptospira TaxID=171 RepID=A0A4R9J7N0_9LEPT|nr:MULTISPECIES: metal-sulfur cluster assembly factor [Leptospira]PJZ25710.1 metal-sulfur cluster biosynthetic enzyme [Leptospira hartskeerlii]PJZ35467.1 metal-sulfur cluster biosynthetic enzyme [Leptospira hartskeerlii]PJZ48051.1 metal-sulfur cluster biosynthetic enzyme [Leptospira saintgironsiae]TGL33784.1 metal-sulfur cluster assembly factor [Leptospira koniambonensis]
MQLLEQPTQEIEKRVYAEIHRVEDPEIGISVAELGLIYKIQVEGDKARIEMTYTSMACPAGPQMKKDIQDNALRVEGINSVDVEVVWTPKWDPRAMASEEAKMDLGIFDY